MNDLKANKKIMRMEIRNDQEAAIVSLSQKGYH